MAYFDYSRPEGIDVTKGLAALGDGLDTVIKARQARNELDLKRQDMMRKQAQAEANDRIQNKILESRNAREAAEFGQRQNEYVARQAERARHAATPQEAAAIAGATEMFDPRTGESMGRGSLTALQPPETGPPPTPPTPPTPPAEGAAPVVQRLSEVGVTGIPPELIARARGLQAPERTGPGFEVPSAEDTRRAEIARIAAEPPSDQVPDVEGRLKSVEAERQSLLDAQRFDAQRIEGVRAERERRDAINAREGAAFPEAQQRFEAEQHAFPERMVAYENASREAAARQPYRLQFGNRDTGTTFDFETQRHAAANQNAQDFMASLPANLTPREQSAAQNAVALLKSGATIKQAQDAYNRERISAQHITSQEELGAEGNKTKIRVAEIGASRPQVMAGIAGQRLDLAKDQAGQRNFLNFIDRQGYKADVGTMKDLIDTSSAMLQHNSALDVTAGAAFARKANGAGVLTDKDYDRFWGAIGGVGARPENFMDNVMSGNMGEEKRRIVLDAIAHKVFSEAHRLRTIATQADKQFAGEPWYPPVRDSYFGFVPGLPDTIPATPRGGPPEVAAKRKGARKVIVKASGSAADMSTEDLLKHVEAISNGQ